MTDNPYAAPPSGIEQEPQPVPDSHGWTVQDRMLLVSTGAVLPMVDPFNGGVSERMTLFLLHVQKRPRWLRYLLIASLAILLAALSGALPPDVAAAAGSAGTIGVFVRLFIGNLYKSVVMRVFVNERTLLKHRVIRGLNIAFIAGLVVLAAIGIFGAGGRSAPGLARWVILAVLALRLVAVLWQREILNRGRTAGGLMKITGVHPAALRVMDEMLPAERKKPSRRIAGK